MKSLPIFLILVLVLAVSSCKTTEANYRQAYEAAVEQRRESTGIDSIIYGRIRNSAISSYLIDGSDSIPVRKEYIGYTEDGGSSRQNVKRYNVVVGQFKQVFNARQMRQRLIDNGYDSAMIVHTREPLYYVISSSVATSDEAIERLRDIKNDKNIVLKSPLPFILTPAHFR